MKQIKVWRSLAAALVMGWGQLEAASYYACTEPEEGADENPNYCKTPALAGWIADALAMCADGDELVLLDGVYAAEWANTGLEIDRTITIRSYTGDRAACVLLGDEDGVPRRAFHVKADGVTFRDLTIRKFWINHDLDPELVLRGGAIYCDGTNQTLFVENCHFDRNRAGVPGNASNADIDLNYDPVDGGGAIYAKYDFVVHVSDSLFTSNATDVAGGAVYCHRGTFQDCGFYANSATNLLTGGVRRCLGGAIYGMIDPLLSLKVRDLNVSATNTVFFGNVACNQGGAWWDVRTDRALGGGVYNVNTTKCTFNANLARIGRAFSGDGHVHYHLDDYFTDFWRYYTIKTECPTEGQFISGVGEICVRCNFDRCGSNPIMLQQATFIDCLFYDNYFTWLTNSDAPCKFFNCTFAYNTNHRFSSHGGDPQDWNSSLFGSGCLVVNAMMVDNFLSSGAITSWNEGKPYKVSGLVLSNSVYQGYVDPMWDNCGNINFTNAPPTEYRFVGTGEHPYRWAKDSFGIDYGCVADPRQFDVRDEVWGRDLTGKRRVSGVAIDVGCYEYQIKNGFAVRVR